MFITLPLMLIGVGFMITLLFIAASYAVPLYAGLVAGLAALHSGASYPGALLLGIVAALLVAFISHAAIQLAPSRRMRTVIALLFAVPASIAGFQVASALMHFGNVGSWGIVVALAAAIATGVVAAKRYATLTRA